MGDVKAGNGAATANGNGAKAKPKKERSPNYPQINLKAAIERAKQFYEQEKKQTAPALVAMSHWGFNSASGPARVLLSTLVKYGLLDEEGRGEERQVKLSRLALNILLDEQPLSPERDAAIKQAALKPKVLAHLWSKYGAELPSEATIRTYLIRDVQFTDSAADDLIRVYKDNIEFAKLTGRGKMDDGEEDSPDGAQDSPKVKVGDFAQWTINGSDQFDPPQQVLGLDENGEYAFFAITKTGVLVEQLTVTKPGTAPPSTPPAGAAKVPPPNPFAKPPAEPPAMPGFKEDSFDLAEGRAVLRWPEKLNPESVADLEDWFDLIIRKMQRMTGAAPKNTTPKNPKPDQPQ